MLQSRFSIPLVAFFVLVVAGCMLYLVKTENIFKTYFTSRYATSAGSTENNSQNIASDSLSLQHTTELERALKATDRKSKKKIPKSIPDHTDETIKPDVSENSKSASGSPMSNEIQSKPAEPILAFSKQDEGAYPPTTDARSFWRKYSQTIPILFNAPLTKDTEERLSSVARLSSELDLLYVENKSQWRRRLNEVSNDFIAVAVLGEREGARALSFQLVRFPLNNTVDALTWALIANAIAPNEYYIYLCSEEFSSCTEGEFLQASAQAREIINLKNFKK